MNRLSSKKAVAAAAAAALEALESRTLFAVIHVDEVSDQLRIIGTGGADKITIKQTDAGIQVSSRGFGRQTFAGEYDCIMVDARGGNDTVKLANSVTINAVLQGGGGADKLIGGAGDDRLFGGGGADTLRGGDGDDVLVSVGQSTVDRLVGGRGRDSFWADDGRRERITDASDEELSLGAVHRVGEFAAYRAEVNDVYQTTEVGKSLNGKDLADPALTSSYLSYKDFSDHPLFASAGPSADDVYQGWLGDCYYLATLSSIADVNPDKIRESVVDLGDGTYAVQFFSNDEAVFVRVDGDLPTWSWGALAYANEGADGSIWVAVMEKAYAFFRYNDGSYASLEGGWMSSVYNALGCDDCSTIWTAADGSTLLSQIDDLLNEGKSVTMAIYQASADAPVVGSHAYSVDRVIRDSDGKVTKLVLRNPWGVDGVGNDGANDGYVTLTAAQAHASFWGVIAARAC